MSLYPFYGQDKQLRDSSPKKAEVWITKLEDFYVRLDD
jgi:hypothetical protein